MKTFDQSLKYLLAHDGVDLLTFALDGAAVEVIEPVKSSLPARGRDIDGGFRVRVDGAPRVAHVEFHRRNQAQEELAVDIAEAQIRLYRRERAEVLSLVWDLYGDRAAPVLSACALAYATGSVSCYTRVNLRGMGWQALLDRGPPALYALVALSADGACGEAVRAAHDAIVARDDLSAGRKADHLAVLWFVSEREDVAVEIIRAYIREEELMQSVLYQEIFSKGELRATRIALLTVLEARGEVSAAQRARVEACDDVAALQQWIRRAAAGEVSGAILGA